ncbi:MAG: hypothetical protein IPL84_12440 [Chitinophagaceae bacterium]|nr:hypothetical protein [Chitinophagaceae bacterium]
MKQTKAARSLKMNLFSMLAAVLIFTAFSCASKASFQTSSVVPAARGDVKVKKDGNNNYQIKIKISGLAEAKRLEPAKQVYVVWLESEGHNINNLGRINSSSSFLSKKLKADFETVSSIKPIKIFITAEDEAGVQYPGTHLILTTNNF